LPIYICAQIHKDGQTGRKPPKATQHNGHLPMIFDTLPPLLAEALATRGYETPTPVQAAVLQPEAIGRDLIVSAQTGSGKTVAFGLAMADQILDGGKVGFAREPLALIVAPTRELALQVSRELIWLYGRAGARIATCVGGMDASKERRTLSQGAQIVVGTPGRLRDHLERGALDLSHLRVAVLDEADEMLDMGFREELESILDATPSERRTLMFSATIPKPIVALAKRYQRDALRISTAGEDRGHGDISFQAVTVAPPDIENAVVNLLRLHEAESAMLFCATRENVRHLHNSLNERGFNVVALSGEHSQQERNHALQALRDRRARVCVATDVAARGIDLPTLSLVIHVELPRDAETLKHRSGRTGRAGKKGTAVLIVPYPRRKRVDMMLRGAKIEAEWIKVPTADDIRASDHERLVETLLAPIELEDEDRALGARLLSERSAEDVAAMLVRMHRAKLPAAEDMLDGGGRDRARDRDRPERGDRPERSERPERGADARQPRDHAGFDDAVWFRMNIGRNNNADPRWILPLLCRRGHITKQDVGAIKIGPGETQFAVSRAAASRFSAALKKKGSGDDGDDDVRIEAVEGGRPTLAARPDRGPRPDRSGPRPDRSGSRPDHKPYGGDGPRKPKAPYKARPTR
jgi:ATP-dependent RNA helicase DeaD